MASEPEVREWDDEWLVRRGNHLTLITPELAERLLERNTNNRRRKAGAIRKYARDMATGRWDPDASDLKFARTGELIDGQNRLHACVQAGVPFPTLVRTGLGLGAKTHVDTGVKRSTADALAMRGYDRPIVIAAAVGLRERYRERVEEFDGRRAIDSGKLRRGHLTHEEVFEYLDHHPTVPEFAYYAQALRDRVMPALTASSLLAGLSWFAEIEHPLAEDIAQRLLNGELGGPGDPLQALLRYAAVARAQRGAGNGGARSRVAGESHLLTLIQVWNAIRAGEPIEQRLVRKMTDRLILPV